LEDVYEDEEKGRKKIKKSIIKLGVDSLLQVHALNL
jgi:hypothetical protein